MCPTHRSASRSSTAEESASRTHFGETMSDGFGALERRWWQRLDGVHGFYGARNQPVPFPRRRFAVQDRAKPGPVTDTGCGSTPGRLKHFNP